MTILSFLAINAMGQQQALSAPCSSWLASCLTNSFSNLHAEPAGEHVFLIFADKREINNTKGFDDTLGMMSGLCVRAFFFF